jgi:hypothetical protein
MPSPADIRRPAGEWTLRLTALGVLGWAVAAAFGAIRWQEIESATGPTLREALVRWSTVAAPRQVGVRLDVPPSESERDWLSALPGAGTTVTWAGAAALPTALALEPAADPAGGLLVNLAAPAGSTIGVRDELGSLDSATGRSVTTRFGVGSAPRGLEATVYAAAAIAVSSRALVRDSLTLRPLLVLGSAGWESKFVVAALEERGWKITAHLAVSPKGDVRQGTPLPIDTARYSAVLALDGTAVRYADAIRRYVERGGGLLLWPDAAQGGGLAALAPGRLGLKVGARSLEPTDSAPRRKLALRPITDLKSDAIALERRDELTTIAVHRVGAGRVALLGYEDLWRWRMHGEEGAPEAHRAWLSTVVAGVAHTGRYTLPVGPADEAPLVSLVDRLGSPASAVPTRRVPTVWLPWIFAALLTALVVEWASRRLDGKP